MSVSLLIGVLLCVEVVTFVSSLLLTKDVGYSAIISAVVLLCVFAIFVGMDSADYACGGYAEVLDYNSAPGYVECDGCRKLGGGNLCGVFNVTRVFRGNFALDLDDIPDSVVQDYQDGGLNG
jgi:hypothetical protein